MCYFIVYSLLAELAFTDEIPVVSSACCVRQVALSAASMACTPACARHGQHSWPERSNEHSEPTVDYISIHLTGRLISSLSHKKRVFFSTTTHPWKRAYDMIKLYHCQI